MPANELAQALRQMLSARDAKLAELERQMADLNRALSGGRQDFPDRPGKRVMYTLVGSQLFTTTQDGARGQVISMLVSQDGPFIWTHFPVCLWRTTLPSSATDFGRWRPVSHYSLADQVLDTNVINISYEIQDAGSVRNFQNEAVPPLFSSPFDLKPLPTPTLFEPNSTIQFIPTYQDILFEGATATTEGRLVVAFPGYRIVDPNMGNFMGLAR